MYIRYMRHHVHLNTAIDQFVLTCYNNIYYAYMLSNHNLLQIISLFDEIVDAASLCLLRANQ